MPRTFSILQQIPLLKGFFDIEEYHYTFTRHNGHQSPPADRWVLNRGDSTMALLHHTEHDTYLLVEQFRVAAHQDGGYLLELPAGRIETGEDAPTTLHRELMEEIGFVCPTLTHITTFYASPGTTSERMHLYYGEVAQANQTGQGGGLIEEGEDIAIVEMTAAELFAAVKAGRIQDGKTIVAVYWLAARLGMPQ